MTEATIDTEMQKKVLKARANVLLDDPFYGYILLRHKMIQDPATPTASIDGVAIRYNPEFVRPLTMSKLKGLLKHEVMHIASMHHLRRNERNFRKWNDAGDYMINNHLVAAGVEIPEGGLVDQQYNGFSTEHIFSILPEPPEGDDGSDGGDGQGNNDGGDGQGNSEGWGDVLDHPGATDDSTRELLEQDAKLDVLQAYNTAKIQGKIPLGIESLVDKIRESKMPWRRILARFFRSNNKSRENWNRPNKRFIEEGIYLPTRYSRAMGPIVIGVDTSGSVSMEEMEAFFGCINSIFKHCLPESITVIYCDAKVHQVDTFTVQDLPMTTEKLKRHGGGGTSFKPVFDYVKKNKIQPEVLLYMTDMYADFPNDPKYPVIWCATSDIKAPWGHTLEISE